MNDVVMAEAEYEEDREDQFDDDDELQTAPDTQDTNRDQPHQGRGAYDEDSLAFSMSIPQDINVK